MMPSKLIGFFTSYLAFLNAIQATAAATTTTTATSSDYGMDISFPMTANDAISTNYPWLPHNVDPQNNPTPEEYENMPLQVLGNRKQVYHDYIQGCSDYWNKKLDSHSHSHSHSPGEGDETCHNEDSDRTYHLTHQPQSMVNYTDIGYTKIKAPEKVYKLILDFWEANKEKEQDEIWDEGGIFVNYWDEPSTMVNVMNEHLIGGGEQLHDTIWNVSSDIISDWTGQQLVGSSVYGIRVYKEGAILSPHVDRLPLISSAIINVAQDVDEPWPLEVIGHDGIARNVTMEPGDMVLYESHSVIHGRPFAMKGRYYANIFIHFMPVPSKEQTEEGALPPYILKDSILAKTWENGGYDGEIPGAPVENWGQHEAHDAARDGHLEALILLAKDEAHSLHAVDNNGWEPIHEAVRSGHEDVIEFLHAQGADLNSITDGEHQVSVLDIALDNWEEDESYIRWLMLLGASVTRYDLGPDL